MSEMLMFLEEELIMQNFTEKFSIRCNLEEKVLLWGIPSPPPSTQQLGPFSYWPIQAKSVICKFLVELIQSFKLFHSYNWQVPLTYTTSHKPSKKRTVWLKDKNGKVT